MKNILVSGASGVVGYGILRSLRRSGQDLRLIGTTIYTDSAAHAFCDVFEQAPFTDDAHYVEWLSGVIERHDIDLLIPGLEADVYHWCKHNQTLEECGAKVVLNRGELISLCRDKWEFYKKLNRLDPLFAIETSLTQDFDTLVEEYGLPFLLKPRSGYASKGIVRIQNADDFLKHRHNIGGSLMVQPIIGTDEEEYTSSAFCDGEGGFYACMTLKRRLSREGFTEKAEVVDSNEIIPILRALCDYFKPIGPTNFQFRRHEGKLKLLEINPRISSSTSIRAGFGYNESRMAVEFYLDDKKPVQPLVRSGKAIRYVEDLFYYENEIRPDL
jgi:carbamoyl-phosphate synthase large subunit